MNQFFSAIDVHIDEKCLLDGTEQAESPFLVSLGIDNMIYKLNVQSGQEARYNLEQQITFDAMTLAPDASHCLFGGKNNAVLQFNFADGSTFKLCEATGNITALKYAPSGRYIAIGSDQGKTLIYQPSTGKKEKCRPGHAGTVWNVTISKSGNLLASIGADQHALIYKINEMGQPMEVARYPITKMENCSELKSSFNFPQNALFVGGAPQLQKLECIQNRWDYSKSKAIMHTSDIIMVEVVRPNTLVTSTLKELCVWSIKQEQKLFQIQQFFLTRVVSIAGKFYGSHNDGKIYEYKREIKEQEPMDIEPDSANDKIEFDVEEQIAQQQGQQEEQEQEEEKKQPEYRQYKKSKADKMITCFPQPPISNATQFYNDSRFLFVNIYGCVIDRQEGDDEKFIDVELQGVNKKQMKFTLGKNKDYSQFAINELGVVYAGQKQFGFRPSSESNNEQWHLEWPGVEALAMGSGWVAAGRFKENSEIRVFDMIGHEIRMLSFDRPVVAMRAFENVLVVVYHESVPMWDCQQLAMQLYMIDSQIRLVNSISCAHVPVTRKSLLRWFDFSREGMLFSQDTSGMMRAFSLQTSEWTQISVDNVEDLRKVWIIGIKNHVVNYWKTTDADPEPTVSPRFQTKISEFSIPTIGSHPEETQQVYQKLAWRRYALDHQKARTRLWANLKISRQKTNLFFALSDSILTEKRIAQEHAQLDEKYFPLIEKYLKLKENLRAYLISQNCIRTFEVSKKIVDLFDYENQRSLAIQFQEYCEQRQKQMDFEQMQDLAFMRLREEAEKCIKPRHEDPMRRTSHRKTEAIPSFSQSSMNSQQFSDHSVERLSQSRVSNLSQNSFNSQQAENKQADNPFLKRKSNHESVQTKKKEISEHIEKFGLKQKADKKSISFIGK